MCVCRKKKKGAGRRKKNKTIGSRVDQSRTDEIKRTPIKKKQKTEGVSEVSVEWLKASMPLMSWVWRRHTLRACIYALVSVSSTPARWFKYRTRATIPADMSSATATKTHPGYISAVLTLKQEKRWTGGREGRRGGEGRGRGGREKEGRPQIHENSAAHTPASAAKSWAGRQCVCVCVCMCVNSLVWTSLYHLSSQTPLL